VLIHAREIDASRFGCLKTQNGIGNPGFQWAAVW
jgi:hypothetical protein